MKSLIRVLKILLWWTYECANILVAFLAISFSFRQLWGLSAGVWIVAILMRIGLDSVKAWAEKF
jgi:hypothetical protein